MSTVPKPTARSTAQARRDRGILIFTYPKVIFIFPTFVMAVICAIGMWVSGNETRKPSVVDAANQSQVEPKSTTTTTVNAKGETITTTKTVHKNFRSPQNMLALLFLLTFGFNLLIIAIDFPRFTVVAAGLLVTTAIFFLLWLGIYVNWLSGLVNILEGLYLTANANFYLMIAIILGLIYSVIFTTRWLDYWEVMPNEILHHHGPWSDLERFPTLNLKFDKEIPDIFEHIMFGAGRLVLRVPSEDRSLILDNVLHVNVKEAALKNMMSRLEVRVTTDQEVSQQQSPS